MKSGCMNYLVLTTLIMWLEWPDGFQASRDVQPAICAMLGVIEVSGITMASNTFTATVEEHLRLPDDIAATPRVRASAGLRHSAMVRIAHWTMVIGVLGLLVSGTGILISHP